MRDTDTMVGPVIAGTPSDSNGPTSMWQHGHVPSPRGGMVNLDTDRRNRPEQTPRVPKHQQQGQTVYHTVSTTR